MSIQLYDILNSMKCHSVLFQKQIMKHEQYYSMIIRIYINATVVFASLFSTSRLQKVVEPPLKRRRPILPKSLKCEPLGFPFDSQSCEGCESQRIAGSEELRRMALDCLGHRKYRERWITEYFQGRSNGYYKKEGTIACNAINNILSKMRVVNCVVA